MVKLKSAEEIKILREGGRILNRILKELAKKAQVGVATKELDWLAENLIKKAGGRPAFKNYQPEYAARAFPATLCTSMNNVVVHGLPDSRLLKEGDILGLDLGMEYKGLYTDMAITIGIGKISKKAKKLIQTAKKALDLAIEAAQPGATLGDIGWTIQNYVRSRGFHEIRVLTGHGLGYQPHENPDVLNYGEPKKGLRFQEGLVIAIEPMVSEKSGEVAEQLDGSFSTKEGCLASHFEHTIAITEKGPIVLTKL